MKRWLSSLLTGLMLVMSLSAAVSAAEAPANRCGENLTWAYENGTLTVTGDGPMDDFPGGAPWAAYQGEIRSVKLQGVTYVGANAFQDYDGITALDLGTSLKEVGSSAFSSCDGLTSVSLPGSFRVFGEESFSHCSNLKEFRFAGSMPSFRLNCLWDTQAKLIYPQNNPWPLEHIQQLEEAFQGRIEFLSADGTDPYQPQEVQPEPAPTAAPTEPPTEAPTEAPTEPPVVVTPVTEPETLPVTQPVTEPVETRPEVPVLPDNQEFVELPEPEAPMGIGMIILIIVMAISGTGILIMAFVLVHNKNKLTQEDFPDPSMNLRPRKQNPETGKTGTKKPENRDHSGKSL